MCPTPGGGSAMRHTHGTTHKAAAPKHKGSHTQTPTFYKTKTKPTYRYTFVAGTGFCYGITKEIALFKTVPVTAGRKA